MNDGLSAFKKSIEENHQQRTQKLTDELKNISVEIRKLLEKQTDIIEQIENEDHINKETENTINNLLNDQRNLREKIEKNRKRQKVFSTEP